MVLVAWFETAELPLAPFRSAPWVEVHEPEAWRAVVLAELRGGPAGVYWNTALTGGRWLARQLAPPEVQAAAHAAELVQRQEVRPQHLISTTIARRSEAGCDRHYRRRARRRER